MTATLMLCCPVQHTGRAAAIVDVVEACMPGEFALILFRHHLLCRRSRMTAKAAATAREMRGASSRGAGAGGRRSAAGPPPTAAGARAAPGEKLLHSFPIPTFLQGLWQLHSIAVVLCCHWSQLLQTLGHSVRRCDYRLADGLASYGGCQQACMQTCQKLSKLPAD